MVPDAQLCGFDEQLLEVLVRTWLPLLDATDEDDRTWDWRGKRDEPCFARELEHLALRRGTDIEGVLMTSIAAPPPAPRSSSRCCTSSIWWSRRGTGPT